MFTKTCNYTAKSAVSRNRRLVLCEAYKTGVMTVKHGRILEKNGDGRNVWRRP